MAKEEKTGGYAASGFGYIITDPDGRVQMSTLRSNRIECWRALCFPLPTGRTFKETKKHYQKMGLRCAPVRIQEY